MGEFVTYPEVLSRPLFALDVSPVLSGRAGCVPTVQRRSEMEPGPQPDFSQPQSLLGN